MTTLAIVGSGIAGRSLLYTLARAEKPFEKITLFNSDEFAPPCTLNSTAIVAPRGVTRGHSPLGDLLLEGYELFKEHVKLESPAGVEPIIQYTGATKNLETFSSRYPNSTVMREFLREETQVAKEEAFLIDPGTYSDWLLQEAHLMCQERLEVINDMVIEVSKNERIHLKTQDGRNLSFDRIIFAGGNYNRFWKDVSPNSVLGTSRPVQGCYLEFRETALDFPSFSLTLDSDNLIWSRPLGRLLIGSTTMETNHHLPPYADLQALFGRIKNAVSFELPEYEKGTVRVGLREKARKRMPYICREGDLFFIGGYYKNGFSLALKMARDLSHQYL